MNDRSISTQSSEEQRKWNTELHAACLIGKNQGVEEALRRGANPTLGPWSMSPASGKEKPAEKISGRFP